MSDLHSHQQKTHYNFELLNFGVLFPGGSDGKASAYYAGDPGSIPGLGRSSGEGWQPIPVFLPGKSHGRRSVVGYSPWGRKELDATERLHSHTLDENQSRNIPLKLSLSSQAAMCLRFSLLDPLSTCFLLLSARRD